MSDPKVIVVVIINDANGRDSVKVWERKLETGDFIGSVVAETAVAAAVRATEQLGFGR